jgi:hypothetical protein
MHGGGGGAAGQDADAAADIAGLPREQLDELQRRTLDELAALDTAMTSSLPADAVYALLEQKAAKELLLSRIGRGITYTHRAGLSETHTHRETRPYTDGERGVSCPMGYSHAHALSYAWGVPCMFLQTRWRRTVPVT